MRFSAGSTAVFIRWSWTSVMNGCDIRIPEGVRIRIRLFGHYGVRITCLDLSLVFKLEQFTGGTDTDCWGNHVHDRPTFKALRRLDHSGLRRATWGPEM